MDFLRRFVQRLNTRTLVGRAGITAWVSKQGPHCYLAPVLRLPAARPALLDLPGGALGWCWASGRMYPASEQDNPDLPALRALTPLIAETMPLLLAELQEERWFTLFGAEAEGMATLLNPLSYQAAIAAFARQEAGPLQIAVYQEGDQAYELIFVPPRPPASVRDLLERWGITPQSVRQTHRVDSTTAGFIDTFMPYA